VDRVSVDSTYYNAGEKNHAQWDSLFAKWDKDDFLKVSRGSYTKESLAVLLDNAAKRQIAAPKLRLGQCIWNEFWKTNRELAYNLRNTEYDCFYDDSKILILTNYLTSKEE